MPPGHAAIVIHSARPSSCAEILMGASFRCCGTPLQQVSTMVRWSSKKIVGCWHRPNFSKAQPVVDVAPSLIYRPSYALHLLNPVTVESAPSTANAVHCLRPSSIVGSTIDNSLADLMLSGVSKNLSYPPRLTRFPDPAATYRPRPRGTAHSQIPSLQSPYSRGAMETQLGPCSVQGLFHFATINSLDSTLRRTYSHQPFLPVSIFCGEA